MFQIIWNLINLILDKYTEHKIKTADDELERLRIQADAEKSKDKWKAVILTSTGAWWFQLFFIIPLALWFAFVVVYSMFWCEGCMYPQPWTVAALPEPLGDWAGAIIAFLFLAQVTKR